MDNSTTSISYSLLLAPYQLNIWFGSFLWVAGNLGCIGNMIVFRSRKFRKRACSIYLLSAAIADFHYFNFVLLTRILQKGFDISLVNRYTIICRLRQFSTLWGNVVSFSLFSFAIIDRLLATHRSNAFRRWSNQVSLAYKMIIIIPFFWFLLIGHRIILYRIQNGLCGPLGGFYEYYDNYFQVIFSSLSPAIVMSVLAYFLLRNVRSVVRRRIAPVTDIASIINRNLPMINQIDKRLTVMLISESLITIVTYVPYAIELTYINISQGWFKTPVRIAWEKVFTELIHLFSYLFFATSFYVSMISNVGFRRKIKQLLKVRQHDHLQDQSISAPRAPHERNLAINICNTN